MALQHPRPSSLHCRCGMAEDRPHATEPCPRPSGQAHGQQACPQMRLTGRRPLCRRFESPTRGPTLTALCPTSPALTTARVLVMLSFSLSSVACALCAHAPHTFIFISLRQHKRRAGRHLLPPLEHRLRAEGGTAGRALAVLLHHARQAGAAHDGVAAREAHLARRRLADDAAARLRLTAD